MTKKNVLIIGSSPLPTDPDGIRTAYSLRTWQFIKPLIDSGDYDVTLIGTDEKQSEQKLIHKHQTSFTHYTAPKSKTFLVKNIKKVITDTQPTAVIAVNNYPAYIVSQIKNLPPFWADLNGWVMAEGHEQSKRDQSNEFLPELFKREKNIALKADHLSTVSTAQKFALCGELMALGRAHKDFDPSLNTSVIPNATELFEIDTPHNDEPLFRGKTVDKDAFVVSFIGGYNTWVDEETLFKSLEIAMFKNENIHFVSTGGALSAVSSLPYQNFRKLVSESKLKDRFHFLGWIETADMAKVYKESNCAINVDHLCLETQTGARNRINEMLKFGLPVITTLGSEISHDLQIHDAALTAPNGNFETLGKHIQNLATDPILVKNYSEKSAWYTNEIASYKNTIKPLLTFLTKPKNLSKKVINIQKTNVFKSAINYLKKYGVKQFFRKLFRR
jgi:glycosyltransferase involved in cell wall biosynthesis